MMASKPIFVLLGLALLVPHLNAVRFDSSDSDSCESGSSSSDDSSSGGHGSGGHHHHHHHGNGNGGGNGNGNGGGRTRRPRPPPPAPPTTPRQTVCEPGWTRVNRAIGGWCVRVFQGITNQAQAQSGCAAYGAILSGIETQEERLTIAGLGQTAMSPTGWRFGTLRLGYQRDSLSSPLYWTDPYVTGNAGVTWSPNEPSGGSTDGLGYNCGMMWLWLPGGQSPGGRVQGTMFTMVCPKTWDDRYRGYVCGKRAV